MSNKLSGAMECPIKSSETLYAKVKPIFLMSKLFALSQVVLPKSGYNGANIFYSGAVLFGILGKPHLSTYLPICFIDVAHKIGVFLINLFYYFLCTYYLPTNSFMT
uniref:Uncharacterized protein n=1 Tax=Cacopsylla melanoneura TaxID=428564 RepID=A0A8D8Y7D6_9HEMI